MMRVSRGDNAGNEKTGRNGPWRAIFWTVVHQSELRAQSLDASI